MGEEMGWHLSLKLGHTVAMNAPTVPYLPATYAIIQHNLEDAMDRISPFLTKIARRPADYVRYFTLVSDSLKTQKYIEKRKMIEQCFFYYHCCIFIKRLKIWLQLQFNCWIYCFKNSMTSTKTLIIYKTFCRQLVNYEQQATSFWKIQLEK